MGGMRLMWVVIVVLFHFFCLEMFALFFLVHVCGGYTIALETMPGTSTFTKGFLPCDFLVSLAYRHS
jgi:hypothetical protein